MKRILLANSLILLVSATLAGCSTTSPEHGKSPIVPPNKRLLANKPTVATVANRTTTPAPENNTSTNSVAQQSGTVPSSDVSIRPSTPPPVEQFFIQLPNDTTYRVVHATTNGQGSSTVTVAPGSLGVLPVLQPYPTGSTWTFDGTNPTLQITFTAQGPMILSSPSTPYSITETPLATHQSASVINGMSNHLGDIPIPNTPGDTLIIQANGQVVAQLLEPVTPWTALVANAMKDISLHTDGIMAPHEMSPTWLPNAEPQQFLTATTTGNGYSYTVNLHQTSHAYPVNSPSITAPQNTGLAQDVGSYGEQDFFTPSGPNKSLQSLIQPSSSSAQPVNLGNGIVGTISGKQQGANLVTWHEGEWTLQVDEGSAKSDLQLAENMVAYLHVALLPETRGVVSVINAGDGQHSTVEWASGDTLYTCTDYHFAQDALRMAVSMRTYPSGRDLSYQG